MQASFDGLQSKEGMIHVNGSQPEVNTNYLTGLGGGHVEHERYWIGVFNDVREHAGVECELDRCSQPEEAYSKYKEYAELYANRLVMLCDRARVLARSDQSPMRRVA
jgi:hypothetical protein